MKITLVSGPDSDPINTVVGSARTCYSKTLKTPEDIEGFEKKFKMAADLLTAGHHTTLQHIHFTFAMEGISRLAIWRFFHSHRFYNSDQVSQRYAALDKENYYKNKDSIHSEEIQKTHESLIAAYSELVELLEIDYSKSSNPVEVTIAKKKAMENARYILPQSIMANMYHTINLSTLIRYNDVIGSIPEATNEIDEIVKLMVASVLEKYPSLSNLFGLKKKSKTVYQYGLFEVPSGVVIDSLTNNFPVEGSFDHYANTTGAYSLFAMSEAMNSFVARYQISLTADAQNQRHRTSIGLRPSLLKEFNRIGNKKEFMDNLYMPSIFDKNEKAKDIFVKSMEDLYSLLLVLDNKDLVYMLPNAFKITIVENTNMSDFSHKTKMRLCLNAQEEIRVLAEDTVKELADAGVDVKLFVPPCVSRYIANIHPTCSEGDHYCGIKEWKLDKYKWLTLIP
jgi:flavin-dependent thymidylate synthase